MERHVKERLVGASILLALVVLLVPEFLSGPKPLPSPPPATLSEPVHSVTVDLNDPSHDTLQEPVATASAVPQVPPAPAQAPVSAPPRTQAPAPTPIETAPNSPIEPAESATAGLSRHASAKGAWGVQLGSFASKANAEKLVHTLQDKGYTAVVSATGVGSAARYRVRIGPVADREAAERLIGRLKTLGNVATLVPPG